MLEGRVSRLSSIVQRILAAHRTCGWGKVAQAPRPGEVRLENRRERVLVAGNTTPAVGERVPWLRLDRGTLVTARSIRPRPPLVLPSGKALPTWTGAWARVITSSFDNGQYDNASPCCAADSKGHAWTAVCESVGDVFRLHFYRGDKDNLLAPTGWASKAHVDFPYIGDPYYRTSGPGWRMPCMLVDDQDDLFAWWHRGFFWEAGQQTANALQGVRGTINPDTGALSLDSPFDLGLPYVDGFGPAYTPDYSGLEMDPEGRLWLVTSPKVTVQTPPVALLYGDDLLVGNYRYALSYQSASSELGCGYYRQVTTRAQAAVPGAPSQFSNPNVGTFQAGYHYFKVTFYKSDGTSGDGETTPGSYDAYNLPTNNRSIRMAIPRSLNNGGRRVYYATSAGGPYYLIWTQPDWNTDYIEIFDPVSSGPQPPTTNTLPAKRTRVWNVDQGPPGTTARHIYRTQAGGSTYGLVGTINNNQNDQEWADDTGDSIGAAPPNSPTNQSYRCLALGHSNAPRSWGSGVTWEKVFGWYPWSWLGDRCGVVALGGGLAAVVYQNTSWGLSARRRTTGGVWGSEVVLVTESGRSFRLGSILLHEGEPQLCYLESGGYPSLDEWYYAPLSVSDDGVSMGGPVLAGDGWDYSEEPPRLSWDEDQEVLVMHGGGFNDYCHIFNVDEGDVESGGDDLSTAGADISWWTAPRRVPGPRLWGLFIDWDGHHGAVEWTPE